MKENILKIALEFQKVLEEKLISNPQGACYLIGYCLSEIYKKQGFKSTKATGSQAVLIKSSSSKYIKYGNSRIKGVLVGNYHTWCEVELNGEILIIDASLKYNLKYLKKALRIKTQKPFADVLITETPNTYHYKYNQDISLESQSLSYLRKMNQELIDYLIQETLNRINYMDISKSA